MRRSRTQDFTRSQTVAILTEEVSAVESSGSENRRSARAEMCRTSALGKKEARAGENGKVGRHIFGF